MELLHRTLQQIDTLAAQSESDPREYADIQPAVGPALGLIDSGATQSGHQDWRGGGQLSERGAAVITVLLLLSRVGVAAWSPSSDKLIQG
ncbi:hypothetical protein scyTo_0014038 [Scyliorhinus torazame]|uniref:Uncharacterized protein n=1 Tax=Scyliorhinus torazame TaxID=75743 RepID=A0A401NG24_SCYTO|nr:hypothetical protein [Scyliorhinus torazame]